MIDKKVNVDEQVQRMKSLMNYGLNENKQPTYTGVEYGKEAADGKLYGIVREGTKYYIKVAKDAKGGLVAENFDYIGGFRNRKDNMFESFASAQRYFCEKLECINESVDDKQKRVIAESWNIDEKKEIIEEGTKKMQAEIARQRQIMKNAQNINEGKKQCCDMEGCKCEVLPTKEVKGGPGAPFTEKLTNADVAENEKNNIKGKTEPVKGDGADKKLKESTETPLVSRENPEYIDKSHGTEIGNNAPFVDDVEKTEGAVAEEDGGEAVASEMTDHVNEEVAMHATDNQDSPAVGVSEKGDNDPFEETAEITEDVELDDTLEDEEDADVLDSEDDTDELEDDGVEDAVDGDDVEVGVEDDVEVDDTGARLDALEDKLNKILDALNNLKYDDEESLYDDGEEGFDDEEAGETEEEGPIDEPEFDEEGDDEYEVIESKSYKAMKARMLREEDDFGKHPAFQKKVMTTPPANMPEKEGQYDMNDESAEGEQPYATQLGDTAPYEDGVESIENAITESIFRALKKKLA